MISYSRKLLNEVMCLSEENTKEDTINKLHMIRVLCSQLLEKFNEEKK